MATPSPCGGSCSNLNGGFKCSCGDGYQLDVDGSSCLDIDECTDSTHNCTATDGSTVGATCRNTEGSYVCDCADGYRLMASDNHSCVAADCKKLVPPDFCGDGDGTADACLAVEVGCDHGTTVGKNCTFRCPGLLYMLEGPSTGLENVADDPERIITVTCTATGSWSPHSKSWCRRSNSPPEVVLLDGGTIDENNPGAVVGTLSTIDPDKHDVHTYSLVGNPYYFVVVDDHIVCIASLDYEDTRSYSIRVTSTDKGGESVTSDFILVVKDGNDAPTAITVSTQSIAENTAVGTVVASLTAVDPDFADSHTFEVIAPLNGYFRIQGSGLIWNGGGTAGRIGREVLDYEMTNATSVTVRCTDNGDDKLYVDQELFFSVTDSNDKPKVEMFAHTVNENAMNGTFIATLRITDQDTDTSKPWLATRVPQKLVAKIASPAVPFDIFDNGTIVVAGDLDYEVVSSYMLRVVVNDDGGAATTTMGMLRINDIAEPPFLINLTKTRIKEFSARSTTTIGSTVGALEIYDEDIHSKNNILVVVDESSLGYFGVSDVECGIVDGYSDSKLFDESRRYTRCVSSLVVAKPLFYPEAHFRNVTIIVVDNTGNTTTTFQITIDNVNDAPISITLFPADVPENTPNGVLVGELSTIDLDTRDSFDYELLYDCNGAFKIHASELVVADTLLVDYETTQHCELIINVTDSGEPQLSRVQSVDLTIGDVNEAPTNISLSRLWFPEAIAVGGAIAQITIDDPDNNGMHGVEKVQHHICTFNDGVDGGEFFVDQNNVIRLAKDIIDYERRSAYQGVKVKCADDGIPPLTLEMAFTLTVRDVNEAPLEIVLSGASVPENAPVGTTVGFLTTTDPDIDSRFSYSFLTSSGGTVLSGEKGLPFVIDDHTGSLSTIEVLDYESAREFTLWVRATDENGAFVDQKFVISVDDTNDVPKAIILSDNVVTENEEDAVVGVLTTVDDDINQQHSYRFVDPVGTDSSFFKISEGKLVLSTPVDYEFTPTLFLKIESRDDGVPFSRSTIQEFTIIVTDVNEAPTKITVAALDGRSKFSDEVEVLENLPPGKLVGVLRVIDPDNSRKMVQSHNCSVTTNGAAFEVVNNLDLILSSTTSSAIDYETAIEHELILACNDNGSPVQSITSSILVRVTNVNEAPTGIKVYGGLSVKTGGTMKLSIGEGSESFQDTVIELLVEDPDNCVTCFPQQTHSIELCNESAFLADGMTLRLAEILDFEGTAPAAENITVVDHGSPPCSAEFRLEILTLDRNDAPTAIFLSGMHSVDEGADLGFVVGNLSVADQDAVGTPFRQHTLTLQLSGPYDTRFWINDDDQLLVGDGNFRAGDDDIVITVIAADGGTPPLSISAQFVLTVRDINIAPGPISLPRDVSFIETDPPGKIVTTVAVTDVDNANHNCQGSGHAKCQNFKCVVAIESCFPTTPCPTGTPGPFAVINGTVITIGSLGEDVPAGAGGSDGMAANYETTKTYQASVMCTDDGKPPLSSPPKPLTVRVLDGNDAPENIRLVVPGAAAGVPPVVAEDVGPGTVVGAFVCDDADSGQAHTFVLASPNPDGAKLHPFAIRGRDLVVQGVLDFERDQEYAVVVTATDNGDPPASTTAVILIRVADSNDAPYGIALECGCRDNPCLHGGTCSSLAAAENSIDFNCSCPEGFSGARCATRGNHEPTSLPKGLGCLSLHPDTEAGAEVLRFRTLDQDKGAEHDLQLEGPASRFLEVSSINGILRLRSDAAAMSVNGLQATVRSMDSHGEVVTLALTFAVNACGGGMHACSSQAKCTPTESGIDGKAYSCKCLPGYEGNGTICTEKLCGDRPCALNTCRAAPCVRGQCFDVELEGGLPGYICDCPPTHAGDRCGVELTACSSQPCFNGGRCTALGAGPITAFQCDCPLSRDLVGLTCAFDMSDCAGRACPAASVCVPRPASVDYHSTDATPAWQCVSERSITTLVYDTGGCVAAVGDTGDGVKSCIGGWTAYSNDFEAFVSDAWASAAGNVVYPDRVTAGPVQESVGGRQRRSDEASGTGGTFHVRLAVLDIHTGQPVPSSTVGAALRAACALRNFGNYGQGSFCGFEHWVPPVLDDQVGGGAEATETNEKMNQFTLAVSIAVGVFVAVLLVVIAALLVRRHRRRSASNIGHDGRASPTHRAPVSFVNPAYADEIGRKTPFYGGGRVGSPTVDIFDSKSLGGHSGGRPDSRMGNGASSQNPMSNNWSDRKDDDVAGGYLKVGADDFGKNTKNSWNAAAASAGVFGEVQFGHDDGSNDDGSDDGYIDVQLDAKTGTVRRKAGAGTTLKRKPSMTIANPLFAGEGADKVADEWGIAHDALSANSLSTPAYNSPLRSALRASLSGSAVVRAQQSTNDAAPQISVNGGPSEETLIRASKTKTTDWATRASENKSTFPEAVSSWSMVHHQKHPMNHTHCEEMEHRVQSDPTDLGGFTLVGKAERRYHKQIFTNNLSHRQLYDDTTSSSDDQNYE